MKYNLKKFDNKVKTKKDILKLFKLVFGQNLTKKFWQWRFEKNPFGKPIIRLAYNKTDLIANYLLQPIVINCKKLEINMLYSMTTMTNPNFAGKGIMTRLANEAYQIGKLKNYSMVYLFANPSSRNLFTKKLKFKEISEISEIIIQTKKIQESNKNSFECKEIFVFNDEFTNFYLSFIKKNPNFIMVPRTKEYLNWRFIQNKSEKYYCYKIISNGKIVGYIILKNYKNFKLQIIDFILDKNIDLFRFTLYFSKRMALDLGIKKISLWANQKTFFYKYLKKCDIVELHTKRYFCVKKLKKIESVFNFKDWYLTMSDSDTY